MSDLEFLPVPPRSEVIRWDKEWMHYFSTEEMSPHLVPFDRLTPVTSLNGLTQEQVFNTSFTKQDDGTLLSLLHVWASGDDLVGKDILEIGSGCGWFGKQIGLVSNSYVGVDISQLAVAIARGNSPRNCTYLHLSDRVALARIADTVDTVVGREFFIHQNFEHAVWVLKLGAFALRSGGKIEADFYMPNPEIRQGVVHPAKSPLDPNYASCAFRYSHEDIAELAGLAGLTVLSSTDYKPYQRRFVTFLKN